jgi:hypothetical protein
MGMGVGGHLGYAPPPQMAIGGHMALPHSGMQGVPGMGMPVQGMGMGMGSVGMGMGSVHPPQVAPPPPKAVRAPADEELLRRIHKLAEYVVREEMCGCVCGGLPCLSAFCSSPSCSW